MFHVKHPSKLSTTKMSRIQFTLSDLEIEIRRIAPQVGEIEIMLPKGAFSPVAGELASQYGEALKPDADRIRCGGIVLRRLAAN